MTTSVVFICDGADFSRLTGAVTRILRHCFTNGITFSVTTTNPLPVQKIRTYHHFTDATQDVVKARVYEGIHFLFADAEGRSQGESVPKWVFKHFLRPVNDSGDDQNDDDR